MRWHRDRTTTERPNGFPRIHFRDLRVQDMTVVAETLLLLPAIQLGVRLVGLQRTAELIDGLIGRKIRGALPVSSATEIERIAQLVRGSCRRWPFGATCLDRSLVTVTLLGRRCVPVRLYIGFRKDEIGLEGHAWVEYNALPLAEVRDVTLLSRQALSGRDEDDPSLHQMRPHGRCDTEEGAGVP